MNILIIVNSLENRNFIQPVLGKKDFNCQITDNVFSGLYAIRKENYKVVIIELEIEDMDGVSIADYIILHNPLVHVIICGSKVTIENTPAVNSELVYVITKTNSHKLLSLLSGIKKQLSEDENWHKIVF